MTTAIVVPTNRPERIDAFVDSWEPQFHRANVRLIVVEDAAAKMITLPSWVEHYGWPAIDDSPLKDFCPRHSGGIRSYGFWLAAQDKDVDVIISLDDDCLPLLGLDLVRGHRAALEGRYQWQWAGVVPNFHSRGFPHSLRGAGSRAYINHGLWLGVPDADALDQLSQSNLNEVYANLQPQMVRTNLLARQTFFPMCIMNVAFRVEATPLMFMAPWGEGRKRWDDIWAGVIAKRACDQLDWPVLSGPPFVNHLRASNPLANLQQEFLGYGLHDRFWGSVAESPKCNSASVVYQYRSIIEYLSHNLPELNEGFQACLAWAKLWR